jgi:hypothetical protein
MAPAGSRRWPRLNVGSGSIATEMGSPRDVRLSSNSGGITDIPALRVCAMNGLMHRSEQRSRAIRTSLTPGKSR